MEPAGEIEVCAMLSNEVQHDEYGLAGRTAQPAAQLLNEDR